MVALRKESVDRNKNVLGALTLGQESLSARRAWIEITWSQLNCSAQFVALRKESVDRNQIHVPPNTGFQVALRKESVDRNMI